jgi:hypothetical protein
MRPIEAIWSSFDRVVNGGATKAVCKYCGEEVSPRPQRMKIHEDKCPARSKKKKVADTRAEASCDPTASSSSSSASICESPSTRFSGPRHQTQLLPIVTSTATAARLDTTIAEFFYSCKLPFNAVEHQSFKNLVHELRPGYEPPGRRALGGKLLDDEVAKLKKTLADDLGGKSVALIQDGWSDVHNSPVIGSVVHTGEKAFFISSKECDAVKKTARYCANVAKEVIKEIEAEYGCHVRAFVCDNERKMDATRAILEKEVPELITYGCNAHLLNLVGQDITPSALLSDVITVQKYFRNHHVPNRLLREQSGSVKPQLPCATRWNSNIGCFETFLRNRQPMQILAVTHEAEIDQGITEMIQDAKLFKETEMILKRVLPIGLALNRMQGDKTSIADCVEIWKELLGTDALKLSDLQSVSRRESQALGEVHFLANLLHPVYEGKKLAPEELVKAQDWLDAKFPLMTPELARWVAGGSVSGALGSASTREKTDPVVWWQALKTTKIFSSDFCDQASVLLKLPASSASIERGFSEMGATQSSLRNRLGSEKAGKLVFCNGILRGCGSTDW